MLVFVNNLILRNTRKKINIIKVEKLKYVPFTKISYLSVHKNKLLRFELQD